ncbi:MAG: hypothetical protein ACREPM_21185 [Gemmatimonadaceae bacterium]
MRRGPRLNKGAQPEIAPTRYFLRMRRMRRLALSSLVIAAFIACGGPPKTAPEPAAHSLANLAAQHIAILPTYAVRVVPGLTWGSIGRPSDLQKTLDADIIAAFDERGIRKAWIFPGDMVQSHKRNPTYAPDPYALAEEFLRSPSLALEQRLPEPLASEVRTLVAMHDDVRYVFAPVELRLEKAGQGGRGVLRMVLVDARLSNVAWIGEFASDTLPAYSPAVTAGIASKFASAVSTQ